MPNDDALYQQPYETQNPYAQTPYAADAEQAVLGAMLIDPDCIKEVLEKVIPLDFYIQQNREIFETFSYMYTHARNIDAITVAQELFQSGNVDEQATRLYLAQLMEITPTSANVMEYVEILRDKSLLRSLLDVSRQLNRRIQEHLGKATEILTVTEQEIYRLRQGRENRDMTPLRLVIPDVLDRLGEMMESSTHLPGLSCGLSALDQKITGLNKSDLILLAGRPGMGKTSLALNMALHAAKNSKISVAIFSLEMSKEQLATRILSSEAHIENYRLKTGELQPVDWEKLASAASILCQTNILIDDNPLLSVAEMNAKCRRIDNLGLIVIDYLQLMTSATGKGRLGENRQQIVSDISRTLKIMAKDLQVPVLCASQLSRANEKRDDKRPMLSDLRESGAIEQDADIVLFLYRDDYYNEDTEKHNIAECIIAKNRHGETGKVELKWLPEYTEFSTLETRYHENDYY